MIRSTTWLTSRCQPVSPCGALCVQLSPFPGWLQSARPMESGSKSFGGENTPASGNQEVESSPRRHHHHDESSSDDGDDGRRRPTGKRRRQGEGSAGAGDPEKKVTLLSRSPTAATGTLWQEKGDRQWVQERGEGMSQAVRVADRVAPFRFHRSAHTSAAGEQTAGQQKKDKLLKKPPA